MTPEKKGFTCGALWAIAELIRQQEEGHAELVWHAGGFGSNDLEVCDDCDVTEIRKYINEWQK